MSGEFELERLISTGAGVALALVAEHFAFYDPEEYQRSPSKVIAGSNILGVATIAIGYGVAKRSVRPAAEVFVISAVAAVAVLTIRYIRHTQYVGTAVDFLAGRIAERIEEAQRDESYARNGSRNFRA